MSDETPPEADRLDDAPHPRHTRHLYGHATAEAAFLDSFTSGRLPHGWLLTGPKGVGKATFAWRAARFLLATEDLEDDGLFGAPPPPETLDIDPDHPVARRMSAMSEPGLYLLRRPWDEKTKRLKSQLTVDEVRGLKGFFQLSAGGNGRRVVIVDSADEMNVSAANALLKELEEPPAKCTLFLISHRPSGLLPTIRSRCRTLRFSSLDTENLSLALSQAGAPEGADAKALGLLAEGSVGTAFQLAAQGGLALYGDLLQLIASLPRMDRTLALRLADATAGKQGELRFEMTLALLDTLLSRLARTGTHGRAPEPILAGEADTLLRLAPSLPAARAWADVAAEVTQRARRGKAVNLDPAALTFDMFLDLTRVAERHAA